MQATENRASTGAHAVPERSGSSTCPRGRPHRGGRGVSSHCDGNVSATIVSNGVDVPPASLSNPDYEYELPLHLALVAQPPTSTPSPGDIELGSAVVFAPNTVNLAQPADASRTTHTSPGKAEQSRDVGNILSACNGVPASVVNHHATGVGEHSHLFERQSRSHHSLDLIMRNDGKAAVASEEAQQSARGLPLVAYAAADGVEDFQGSRHVGLAQAASCDAIQQTTAVPRRLGLERQLNRFTASDLFLGRFEMLGRHHRRRGGVISLVVPMYIGALHDLSTCCVAITCTVKAPCLKAERARPSVNSHCCDFQCRPGPIQFAHARRSRAYTFSSSVCEIWLYS